MTDWRLLFDSNYIRAFHLQGKEFRTTIERVTGEELTGEGGRKSKKPVLVVKPTPSGAPNKYAIPKTVAKLLASSYGNDTAAWEGKEIVLYPTRTSLGGSEVDCIRIKLPK